MPFSCLEYHEMELTSWAPKPYSVTLWILTALQLHCAGLDVHGEVHEVHWAGQNEGQPGRNSKKEVTLVY